ncbi:MAG: hypothetical protein GY841_16030 [FCB group bacterium]|nr:hypothetical protein [FCB group bacterium]
MSNVGSWKIFPAVSVSAGATQTYPTGKGVPIQNAEGYFALQVTATMGATAAATTGYVDYQYLVSLDNTNFMVPTGGGTIATGHYVTGGPGTDGMSYFSFSPETTQWIKIRAINRATDAIVTTVHLGVK